VSEENDNQQHSVLCKYNVNIINAERWFKSNSLLLNVDKTHLLQFCTKIGQIMDLEVHYENKQITAVNNIKFLGLIID